VDFSKPGPGGDGQRRGRTRIGGVYSALIGWGAAKELPTRLRPFAYRAFARAVGANLGEPELGLAAYPSFGDFFARRLRNGARVIDASPASVISPCDGVVAACGRATDGVLVQAKGRNYTLAELLASDPLAARFSGGDYATIYLSPRDYHRVHAPIGGALVAYDYLPGALWPVNPRIVARRDGVFARNERVVIELSSPLGDACIVMVGAAGVGNIVLAHRELRSAELRGAGERRRIELGEIAVERGDELGAFRLGSTVVLVFEPGRTVLDLEADQVLRFGVAIGRVTGPGGRA